MPRENTHVKGRRLLVEGRIELQSLDTRSITRDVVATQESSTSSATTRRADGIARAWRLVGARI